MTPPWILLLPHQAKLYFFSYSRDPQAGITLRSLLLEVAVFRYIPIPGSSQSCWLIESYLVPDVRLAFEVLRIGKALPYPAYTMIITRVAEQHLFPILSFIAKFSSFIIFQ